MLRLDGLVHSHHSGQGPDKAWQVALVVNVYCELRAEGFTFLSVLCLSNFLFTC